MQVLSNLVSADYYGMASKAYEHTTELASSCWKATKRKVTVIKNDLGNPVTQNRCYNGFVKIGVSTAFAFNKSASTQEYVTDLVPHTYHVFVLSENASYTVLAGGAFVNGARLIDIFIKATYGTSTIPFPLNLLDIINHGYNFAIIGYIAGKKAGLIGHNADKKVGLITDKKTN